MKVGSYEELYTKAIEIGVACLQRGLIDYAREVGRDIR
jgi:hypothetical protein